MAFTKKKFIDITGLSTFRNSLLGTSIEEANKTTENKTASIKAIAEYVDSEVDDLSSAVTTGLAEKISSVSYDSTNKKLTYNKGGSIDTDIVETSILKADIDAMQYGTCSTTASTQAKVVDCPNFKLVTGARIAVKFTVTNTASSPTLNVNGTGAKAIYYRGSAISASYLANNRTYEFVYNGTQYDLIGDIDTNSNTVPQGYCSTSAGTAAKGVTCSSYSLLANSYLMVVMAYANTSATALTLNVNSKGAKPIYINGTASSSSNYTLPAGSYLTYYDGTNYYFRTDGKITGNITGSASSATTAGSATNDSDGNQISTTYVKGNIIATSSTLGLVKSSTTGTTANRDYAVGVNSDGTMKVNVPWTDTKYTHPTYTSKTSGLYKITVDGTGHVSDATAVTKADITGLGIPSSDTNTTYTVASGDSNGQIKVTPSSGSAYNVSVKGLGSAAYTESSVYAPTSHTHSVSDIDDLDIATSSTLGLVKSSTTGTTANRDYAVGVNSDGTMKVNVPWTDKNVSTSLATSSTTAYITGSTSASATTGALVKDTKIYISSNTGKLVATTFQGALEGNADTSTQVKTIGDSTNATRYLTFVDGNNSSAASDTVYTHSGLKYNPSTSTLTTTTFSGALSGNATSATDATYATKIGTSSSHPGIGSASQPVYVNSNGVITAGTALGTMAYKATSEYLASTTRGAQNGVASLDANGLVPSSQLPSYVDDVLEYSAKSSFPSLGETGKIYVDTSTNLTYRWSGSAYVEISPSLALGETSSTAYAGDKGATLATNLSTHTGNTTVHITSNERTTWDGKYTKPSDGIPKTDLASVVKTSLDKADSALQSISASISGSGNAVTSVTASGGSITVTKDTTFLTSHQDISGKEDKSNKVTAWSTTTTDEHYPTEKLVKTELDKKADTFTVTNGGNTASWGSSVTVGTVAGTNLTFTMPVNPDTNTTYTVASGDSNGQIKVTPSSGSAYNVSVKGLGSNAYTSTSYLPTAGGTITGTTASSSTSTGALIVKGGLGVAGNIYGGAVYGAVWNDLSDSIPLGEGDIVEPGYCYGFDGEHYTKTSEYMQQSYIGIHSDTYGFKMGTEGGKEKFDVAVSGFVLAYVDKEYPVGTPLTCTANGYLIEISKEDKRENPDMIIARYWKSEPNEEWGAGERKVKVNGRKWVKIY